MTKVSVALATPDTFGVISSAEWQTLCLGEHNILLEGPRVATEALLAELMPSLRTPTVALRGRRRLRIPKGSTNALVVRDVHTLSALDQEHLMRWLSEPGSRQVIATTEERLFSRVARGQFNEALYYRLNVILLRFDGASMSDALQDDHEEPFSHHASEAAPAL